MNLELRKLASMVVEFSRISWRISLEQLLMSSMVYLRLYLSALYESIITLRYFWWLGKDVAPTSNSFSCRKHIFPKCCLVSRESQDRVTSKFSCKPKMESKGSISCYWRYFKKIHGGQISVANSPSHTKPYRTFQLFYLVAQ